MPKDKWSETNLPDPSVETVTDALILPLTKSGRKSYSGGVLDRSGAFVDASGVRRGEPSRWILGPDGIGAVPSDDQIGERLDSAVYCGPLFDHFGHFLLEGLARLWWVVDNQPDMPCVFIADGGAPSYAESFLDDFAPLKDVRVLVSPTRVSHLIVPGPAFEIGHGASAKALLPFRAAYPDTRLDGNARPSGKIYLSRKSISTTPLVGEDLIERVMAKNGYDIVYPEKLPLKEQVRTVRAASHIAGPIGSALHLNLFAEGRQMIYFSPMARLRKSYHVIDQICGHSAHYLICSSAPRGKLPHSPGEQMPFALQIARFRRALRKLRFDLSALPKNAQEQVDRAYAALWYEKHARALEKAGDKVNARGAWLLSFLANRPKTKRAKAKLEGLRLGRSDREIDFLFPTKQKTRRRAAQKRADTPPTQEA
ncbi:MAG: glycosyltransferase family 61 protein [Pseudomonadota bacterium]